MRVLDIKRQMGPTDVQVVQELLDTVERADGHRPLSDHLWLDLVDGGHEGFAGLVAWEPGHEHLVAYAQISKGNGSHSIELVVHPHHRYEMHLIGPELLSAALSEVARNGGGPVHWWVFEPTKGHEQVASEVGLTPGRTLHQMRRSLPLSSAEAAEALLVRTFVASVDDRQWLELNNRAFAHHPEQGGWDGASLSARMAQPWFEPEGFIIHEIDGQMAGFCWTKVHRDMDPVLGEIYVVAVDPAHVGHGLGRSMVVSGLVNLAERGVTAAMLFVDADNGAAMRLYGKLGFRIHRTDRAFVGNVGTNRIESSR